MGSLPDILMGDGTTDLHARRGLRCGPEARQRASPELQVHERLPGRHLLQADALDVRRRVRQLIVRDNQFRLLRADVRLPAGLDPTVFFTPGRKGYLLFAKNAGGRKQRLDGAGPGADPRHGSPPAIACSWPARRTWSTRTTRWAPSRAARAGAVHDRCRVRRACAEHKLPSPPVFNGLAAARGHCTWPPRTAA